VRSEGVELRMARIRQAGARMKELSFVQEYYSDLLLRKEIKKYKHRDPVFVTSAEIKGILNYLGYR
jgi:uroporphyrinogen-III synthase